MDASVGYSINNIYMKFKINNIADKVHYTNTVYSNQYIPGYGRNALFTIGLNI
jgi:iron complex outermembrane receptor protein